MIARFIQLFETDDGQALAEYALILGFIAAVAIVALTALGLGILTPFQNVLAGGFGGGGGSS